MGRVEGSLQVSLTGVIELTAGHGAIDGDAGHLSLLPPPVGGVSGIAEQLARIVAESAMGQRRIARDTEAVEERSLVAAESREVAVLREKAKDQRQSAVTEGVLMIGGGALSATASFVGANGSEMVQKNAKGAGIVGDTISKSAEMAKGLGNAEATEHDATIASARATARRATRSADDAKKTAQELGDLIGKALAFVRDASRTEADTSLAAIRRA